MGPRVNAVARLLTLETDTSNHLCKDLRRSYQLVCGRQSALGSETTALEPVREARMHLCGT